MGKSPRPQFGAQALLLSHGHSKLRVFMIVNFMTHSQPLLHQLLSAFALYTRPLRVGWRHCILPADIADLMEQTGNGQQHIGIPVRCLRHPVQKELRVGVPLFCGSREPLLCHFQILRLIFPHQVQLAQRILSVVVSFPCGAQQIVQRKRCVLWDILPQQIELSKAITGILVFLRGSFFIPGYRFRNPVLFLQQLAKGVLGKIISRISGASEPQFRVLLIWQDA